MDDPKARIGAQKSEGMTQVVPPQFIALTPEQFAALTAGRPSVVDDAMLEKQARMQADAFHRSTKRENETHPGKSVFSNPKGEIEDPKEKLKCDLYWAGMGEPAEILTPEEIHWINKVVPGEYTFTRTDGSPERLLVVGEYKPNGGLRSLDFQFRCTGAYRTNLPGKVPMIREILGEQNELDRLRAENEKLKAERLAGVSA